MESLGDKIQSMTSTEKEYAELNIERALSSSNPTDALIGLIHKYADAVIKEKTKIETIYAVASSQYWDR